jgi:hypothetical protein
MDQARARKHDTDLSNRLTDQGFGLLGRDAVLMIIGLQNAGTLPDCGAPAGEQIIDLAGRNARYGAHGAGGLTDGAHDHQSPERCADAPHSVGFGDGGGIVIRLPGRVLTGGRAAAIEAAGAASQIPADGNPQVYDEGSWSRVNACAGQFGLTGPADIVKASGVPGAG